MNVEQALGVVDTIYDETDVEHVLAAEFRRLREQRQNDDIQIELLEHRLESFRDDNARLREENERLRKDAGRYQWLRELVSSKDGTIQAQGLFWNCSHSRRKLDADLDAARSAKTLPEPAP